MRMCLGLSMTSTATWRWLASMSRILEVAGARLGNGGEAVRDAFRAGARLPGRHALALGAVPVPGLPAAPGCDLGEDGRDALLPERAVDVLDGQQVRGGPALAGERR